MLFAAASRSRRPEVTGVLGDTLAGASGFWGPMVSAIRAFRYRWKGFSLFVGATSSGATLLAAETERAPGAGAPPPPPP